MADPRPDDDTPRPVELRLPARTIGMALLGLLAAVVAIKLWPLCLLVVLALLVAVTLHPVTRWLERRGAPHWAAVLMVALAVILLIGAFAVLALPPLAAQGEALVKSMPKLREDVLQRLPDQGFMQDFLGKLLSQENLPEPGEVLKRAVTFGGAALSLLAELGLVLVIAVYLLFDGDRAWRWLLPYFPPRHRQLLHRTAGEVSEVIFAYVAGNCITSVLCTIYTFVVLTALHVPAALVLAMITGVFDILPIVGFICSVVPALLLALSVSPTTAMLVGAFYLLYHGIESYLIVPRVYGSRMRLSTLTVLLALFAGAMLAGIPGAIIALPLVASYPIIERIWLAGWLGREVVEEHAVEEKKKT